ncbi:MAG: sigma 54-interacting transcriptional regulator [Planctomycetaceae bacterium]
MVCRRTATAPRIDGRLDEADWAQASALSVGTKAHLHPAYAADWSGPADLSATVRALITGLDLYLGIDVTDDVHLHESGRPWWVGDSVELFFDTSLEPGDDDSQYSSDDFQLFLTPFHQGQRWGVVARAVTARSPDGGLRGVRIERQVRGEGYTLECKIPLLNLEPLVPDAEGRIGFDLAINDVDRPGDSRPESYLTLSGRFDLFSVPANFARLRLGARPPRPLPPALEAERYLTWFGVGATLLAVVFLAWILGRMTKRLAPSRRSRTRVLALCLATAAALSAAVPPGARWIDEGNVRSAAKDALAAAEAAAQGFFAVDDAAGEQQGGQGERLHALFRDGRVRIRPRYRYSFLPLRPDARAVPPSWREPGPQKYSVRIEPGGELAFPLEGAPAPPEFRLDLSIVPPIYREGAAPASEIRLEFAEGPPILLRPLREASVVAYLEVPSERVGAPLRQLRVRSLLAQSPMLVEALYSRDDAGRISSWPLPLPSRSGVPLDLGRGAGEQRLVALAPRGTHALKGIDRAGHRLWLAVAAQGAYPHSAYGQDAARIVVRYADGLAPAESLLQNGRDIQDQQLIYAQLAGEPEVVFLEASPQDPSPAHFTLYSLPLDPRRRVESVELSDLGVVSSLRIAAVTLGERSNAAPPPASGLVLQEDLLGLRPETASRIAGRPLSVRTPDRVIGSRTEFPGFSASIPLTFGSGEEGAIDLRLRRSPWVHAILEGDELWKGGGAVLLSAALVVLGADLLRRARHLRVKMLAALGSATLIPLAFLLLALARLIGAHEERTLREVTLADLRTILERIQRAPAQARALAARARDMLEIAGEAGTPAHEHLLRSVRGEIEAAGAFLRIPDVDASSPSRLGNASFFDALSRPGLYYSPWDGLVAFGLERAPRFRRYIVGLPSASIIGESPSPDVSLVLFGPDGEALAASGDLGPEFAAGELLGGATQRRGTLMRLENALYEERTRLRDETVACAHDLVRDRGRVVGMLGVYRSRAATESAKSVLVRTVFGAGMAAVLLVIVVGGSLADRVSARLRRVTYAARTLAEGDLSLRVPVEASDEISRLAISFNTMADSLDTRVRQLTELHTGLQALTGALDRREVAATAVALLERSTGACSVAVAAMDVATGRIELLARRGEPPALPPRVPETGLLRRAVDARGPASDNGEACIPLVAAARIVGLAHCSGFGATLLPDLKFLDSLGRQIGIALENARLYQVAVTDELTGLYTHEFFVRRLREEVDRAAAGSRPLSLVRVGIENLATLTASLGQEGCARLVAEAAALAKRALPRRNVIALRDEGELEVLLVEGDETAARAAADALAVALEELRSHLPAGGPRPEFAFTTVSYPADGASARILLDALRRGAATRIAVDAARAVELSVPARYGVIVARSPSLRPALEVIARVAPTRATVLLSGETGTGKEVLADLIQCNSDRREKPYVKVNCAAIPEGLLEAELFGHERGAFTGAERRRIGRFEEAHGGTLLLDEVGELPLAVQGKLLRVLQEKRITRVGGSESVEVDLRLLAATNRSLEQAIRQGTFREDLYYRIHVIEVRVPPLRERREEIPHFVEHFRQEFNRRHGLQVAAFSPEALDALYAHAWPGNVRELRNALERAMLVAAGPTVERQHLALAAVSTPPHPSPVVGGLTPRQERILARARLSGAIANNDVVALEGVSPRTALRELDGLVQRGLLLRQGRRRGALYRPGESDAAAPAGETGTG